MTICLFTNCKQNNTDVASKRDAETSNLPSVIEEEVKNWTDEDTRSVTGYYSKRGLIASSSSASEGLILFSPSASTSTYLMNKKGEIVHIWKGTFNSMQSYLKENGNLVRLERDPDFPTFAAGGQAGRIREYNWAGDMVWDFRYVDEKYLNHHDIEIMPNGNILAIAYEVKTKEEAVAAGRNPEHTAPAGIWPDRIIEIKPTPPSGGEIVWEWKMWDHLVQDTDSKKPNFGKINEHPRRININVHEDHGPPPPNERIQEMIKAGVVTSNATSENWNSDISHVNAVDYNELLDQIAISSPGYSEIYIIDHSTTTEEAKESDGGRWGHGGDLLYRWGNPKNYGRGSEEDQVLFGQHDIRWIPKGSPGAGNLMVFNNDIQNKENEIPSLFAIFGKTKNPDPMVRIGDISNYSAVLEFAPPIDEKGNYLLSENIAFGPDSALWTYTAPDKYSMYSPFVSGAERLKNGNTLILSGAKGRMLEVNAQKQLVWDYWAPYFENYKLPDGTASQPVGPFIFGQFRVIQYDMDFQAFNGRDLQPINPQPKPFVPEKFEELSETEER